MLILKFKNQRKSLLFLAFGLFLCLTSWAQNNVDRLNYIEKYKDIAIDEMERAGIPASIKLAQAILESASGKSVLARKANNHFGMKCGSAWKGKTFYREDDDYDEQGNLLKSCFRVYKNPEASFIAHSEFLRDPRKEYRYGPLFRIDPKNYKRWALGLKKAGYATNPRYPDLLIKIIEDYELYLYDNMSPNETVPTPPDVPNSAFSELVLVNNIRTAVAKKGETVLDLANRTQTPINRIFKYNEEVSKGNQVLEADYRVFLQPKRNAYQGRNKYHYVRVGQTMMDISQIYGIKLKSLYKRNRIPEGKEPKIGTKLKLRGWRIAKAETPKLRKPGEDKLPPATLPVRDLEQDQEIDFDSSIPSTSLDDFEAPKADTGKPSGTKPPATPKPTEPQIDKDKDKPTKPDLVTPPQNNSSTKPPVVNESSKYYTVLAGDTLYRIARKYQTSVPRLKELNGLKSNLISVGQRLRVQ